MRRLARLVMASLATMVTAVLLLAGSAAAQDERTRVFNAPAEKVWAVTISVLESLGWKVDKEDRAVGWLVTKSRTMNGEEYGVYAKGSKHRLRIVIKSEGSNRTAVTVERRAWKEERILWMDKEEELPATDRTVEARVLSEIARSL
jgi:5-enolpyruvylshikimate-3-phosphate synthase